MKKFLVGAVATAALLTPCVANAETNALVGIQYANTDIDDEDYDAYGFNGGFSHDLNNGWFIQMDGEYNRVDIDGCCYTDNYAAFHAGMRSENHAVAGFVSLGDFFGYSGLGYGLEGSLYWNNIVLNGVIAHEDFSDIDVAVTTYGVDGSYFFTPNFAINAEISQNEGDDAFDGSWTTYGIGGEWRMPTNGTSFTLGWSTTDYDSDFDADTLRFGVNFDLGTGSLRERASEGPSLGGAQTLNAALNGLFP